MADSDSDQFQSADEGDKQTTKDTKNKPPEGGSVTEKSQASGANQAALDTKSKKKKGRNKKGKKKPDVTPEVRKPDMTPEVKKPDVTPEVKKPDVTPEVKKPEVTQKVENVPRDVEDQENKQSDDVGKVEQERTQEVLEDQKEEQKEGVSKSGDDIAVEKSAKLDDVEESIEQTVSSDGQGALEVSAEPEPSATESSIQQEESEKPVAVESQENTENETESVTDNVANETAEQVDTVPSEESNLETRENVGVSSVDDPQVRTETNEPEAPEEQRIQGALDRLAASGGGQKTGGQEESQASVGGGGWGWGGWGSSLLSSATSKVSAVGHGLSSVIENVESSLGVPRPDEIIQQDAAEKVIITSDGQEQTTGDEGVAEIGGEAVVKKEDGQRDENAQPSDDKPVDGQGTSEASEASDQPLQSPSSLGGWFSFGATALTSAVEKTVTGGLDALELLGKKTMDVLQDGDPGFRKKRAYISETTGQSINLSEMIREAKEKAETASQMEEVQKEKEKFHFGILFDNYQGLAHLEALEMLANQSEIKVHGSMVTLSGDKRSAVETELTEIKDAFELEDLESDEIDDEIDEHDFVNLITEHLFGVCVAATPNKLHKVQKDAHEWLAECQKAQEDGEKKDAMDLHIKAIETLAELTARSIEQFHKSAELMLLHQDKDQHKSLILRATSLSKLTSTLCAELSSLSSKFCENLNTIANDESTENASETINPIITNIYLEASNSASYIQDAFQLLLPVLQALAVENSMEEPQPEAASTS